MKYTEDQIQELTLRVLSDLKIDYFIENSFSFYNHENSENIPLGIWEIYVEVPHEQFIWLTGILVFEISDEDLTPLTFHDISGGRSAPMKLVKLDGKYKVDGLA